MDRWVGGRKFKLPRSKSPFNEKTIFVETKRATREGGRRAFKFTRERLFVRSRARMGNQSTSKTSPSLFLSPALPSVRIHCEELLLNLICYKTILSTALGIWAKNCPGILSLLRSVCPRDPLVLLMPRNRSGHIPPQLFCGDWPGRLRPRVRAAAAGFAKASLQIWKV